MSSLFIKSIFIHDLAFAAISALEVAYNKKKKSLVAKLSEQQLVDCDGKNLGCSGGWVENCNKGFKLS